MSILATVLGLPLGVWAARYHLEGLALSFLMMTMVGPFGIYISGRIEEGRAEIVGPRAYEIARTQRRRPALHR
ncbi:hypothetical protein [Enhygromyxa salina]|uniref:hypothetical protein n=1 Tax=Enhygromyxa salina TaxID=215803 RepID=UPI0011BA5684|nr:hypothetical protein [Enhygromyxa salina]